MPSATCLRASANGMPGTAPTTSTTMSAPSAAASSIARLLSSMAWLRALASTAGKNPPRQSAGTLRPASATILAAASMPIVSMCWRQMVIAGTPARW